METTREEFGIAWGADDDGSIANIVSGASFVRVLCFSFTCFHVFIIETGSSGVVTRGLRGPRISPFASQNVHRSSNSFHSAKTQMRSLTFIPFTNVLDANHFD